MGSQRTSLLETLDREGLLPATRARAVSLRHMYRVAGTGGQSATGCAFTIPAFATNGRRWRAAQASERKYFDNANGGRSDE
jgi:hypothetical protein